MQEMSGFITARVTKLTPSNLLGISFAALQDGRVKVTEVSPTSPFRSTPLEVGQEILSINETPVHGMDVLTIKVLLESIPQTVIITAKPSSRLFELTYDKVHAEYMINASASEIPPALVNVGLSLATWTRIFDAYSNELLPAALRAAEMEDTFLSKVERDAYQETQNFKKMLLVQNEAAVLHTNCTLAAANVLALSNVLLNPHEIVAQVTYQRKALPKWSVKSDKRINVSFRPKGLEFLLIEHSTHAVATPISVAHAAAVYV